MSTEMSIFTTIRLEPGRLPGLTRKQGDYVAS